MLHFLHAGEDFGVLGSDPLDAKTGQPEGFRDDVEREPLLVDIGDEGEMLGSSRTEPMEDLVVEDVDAVVTTHLDQGFVPVRGGGSRWSDCAES